MWNNANLNAKFQKRFYGWSIMVNKFQMILYILIFYVYMTCYG